MSDPIVPQTLDNLKPLIRYHRITPIVLHTGTWLHIANGVVEVGPTAWLGQVTGDDPAFLVAGFLVDDHYAYPAPVGWQADILASSSLNNGGGPEPPPTWAAALRRPMLLPVEVAA